jgi:hypothetical protein
LASGISTGYQRRGLSAPPTRIKTVTVEVEPEISSAAILSGTRNDPECSYFSNKWKRCGTIMPTVTVRFGGTLSWSCTSGCEFVDSTGEVSVAEDVRRTVVVTSFVTVSGGSVSVKKTRRTCVVV